MFLFCPCQVGAEKVLKSEMERLYPSLRFSFSRPGFLTFKMTEAELVSETPLDFVARLTERSVFARTASLSLDRVRSETVSATTAEEIWRIADQNRFFVNRIHLFRRDTEMPGRNGFEPGPAPELYELHRLLVKTASRPKFLGVGHADPCHPALPGETVLDVVQVEPGEYYIGVHLVAEDASIQAYYPGGVIPLTLPENAVSRAWLKFEEGLRWSGLPIGKEALCVDIGSAPGGGSQALLDRGAEVLGVDPGEMAPLLLKNPRFHHIRGKLNQTKRSLYRDVHWAIADMNVAPNYTLDVLSELTSRKEIKIRGLLFTLKLFQWELAARLTEYAARVRRWGFAEVRIKQLAFNRREVMVAAQKKRH